MKRFGILGVLTLALVFGAHARGMATGKLELKVSPAVSMAPAYVTVRVMVEPDRENRELEIIADSGDFYRRTVMDLEGEQAPKINELKLIDIPGGEYDVSAILHDAHGVRLSAHQSIIVTSTSTELH